MIETTPILDTVAGILAAALRYGTPILLTALGELLVEKSGVLNMGCEGMMDLAAFGAFVVAYLTGNLWEGVLVGMACGMLLALLMGLLSVGLGTDQILNGIAITTLSGGITVVIFRIVFRDISIAPNLPSLLAAIEVPILSGIPVIGPAFFQQPALTYLAIALVPIVGFLLSKTTFGLETRASGENPEAVHAAGIKVSQIRYLCLLFGGALAGIGGASLTTTFNDLYLPGIVGGRGFMAIAIVILGGWSAWKVFGGTLLFGGTFAFQMRLQPMGLAVPRELLLMMPYLVALVALVIGYRKAAFPASLAKAFRKE